APRSGKTVYVPKNPHEKAMQRALIQYRNPENYELVKEALLKAGRGDLIGFDKKCLIRPRKIKGNGVQEKESYKSGRSVKAGRTQGKGQKHNGNQISRENGRNQKRKTSKKNRK
ncbi:MAG: DUF3362 domain-containing protein, partial [Lachnospiraceae bacterium]|nr:DUF3362 domain-containing protein [Lachnospiraceae bacterium]